MPIPPGNPFFAEPIEAPVGEDLHADGNDPRPPDGYAELDVGYSDDHLQFPYLLQQRTTSYVGQSGLLQLPVGAPVASDGAKVPAKIVRAHAPVMQKIVSYSYVRLGAIPVVPPPETEDPNLRLLEHVQMPLAAHEQAVGQYAYGLSGQYVYAMYEPLNTDDDKPFGRNDAYRSDAVETSLTASNFDASLLDG